MAMFGTENEKRLAVVAVVAMENILFTLIIYWAITAQGDFLPDVGHLTRDGKGDPTIMGYAMARAFVLVLVFAVLHKFTQWLLFKYRPAYRSGGIGWLWMIVDIITSLMPLIALLFAGCEMFLLPLPSNVHYYPWWLMEVVGITIIIIDATWKDIWTLPDVLRS